MQIVMIMMDANEFKIFWHYIIAIALEYPNQFFLEVAKCNIDQYVSWECDLENVPVTLTDGSMLNI